MPIEIKELIIQALVGNGAGKNEPEESEDAVGEDKNTLSQLDTIEIVSKMIKNEKER